MRRPWRIRWWCTAAVASSAGIGMRSADTARSDRIRMLRSASTASVASAQMRSSASSRPAAPSAAGQVVSMVAVRNAPSSSSSIERIFSSSALVRTGCATSSRLCVPACAAEQVRARADHRHQRHHQLLADRIDRRVGDLREVLLEIVVEQLGLAARARRSACRCPSSRPDRRRSLRHRLEEEAVCLPACSRRPAGDRAGWSDRWTARAPARRGSPTAPPACTASPSATPRRARLRRACA